LPKFQKLPQVNFGNLGNFGNRGNVDGPPQHSAPTGAATA
jgi:hypothetical protein